jgi:hypothetical protein
MEEAMKAKMNWLRYSNNLIIFFLGGVMVVIGQDWPIWAGIPIVLGLAAYSLFSERAIVTVQKLLDVYDFRLRYARRLIKLDFPWVILHPEDEEKREPAPADIKTCSCPEGESQPLTICAACGLPVTQKSP